MTGTRKGNIQADFENVADEFVDLIPELKAEILASKVFNIKTEGEYRQFLKDAQGYPKGPYGIQNRIKQMEQRFSYWKDIEDAGKVFSKDLVWSYMQPNR